MGFFPEPLDHRLCELFRADLLLADALVKDVICVHAVFNRPQPGVVHALRRLRLSDVHEHHDRAEQQTGRIRKILSRASRS